jgi:hypothetical protein
MRRIMLAMFILFSLLVLGQPNDLARRLGAGQNMAVAMDTMNAKLNMVLADARVWVGLEDPVPASESVGDDGTQMAHVQGSQAPQDGTPRRTRTEALVTIKSSAMNGLRESATMKMVAGLDSSSRPSGPRFLRPLGE